MLANISYFSRRILRFWFHMVEDFLWIKKYVNSLKGGFCLEAFMMRLARSFQKLICCRVDGYVNFVWIVKVDEANLRRLETLDLFPDKILDKNDQKLPRWYQKEHYKTTETLKTKNEKHHVNFFISNFC